MLRDLCEAAGYSDGPGEVAAIDNGALLKRYMDDFRFFLEKNGNDRSLIQLEPDFWGYVQSIDSNPRQVPAQVASANPTDCASQENSAAGLASCMISMVSNTPPTQP